MHVIKIILIDILIIICLFLLGSTIKGKEDSALYYQTNLDTRVGSPFETSNNSSRYAQVVSLVRDHSFFLSDELAQFSAPDVVYYHQKFFSIFLPGVAFIGIPFYYLGNLVGLPQLFAFSSVLLLAITNAFLVALLAKKFGAGNIAALIAGFSFLFATNALPYAHTFTQHHPSITLLLLSLYLVNRPASWLNNFFLGAVFGASLLFDFPNLFILMPIGIYTVIRQIKPLKLSLIFLLLGALPMLGVLAWYNNETTGSYLKTGQFIGRSNFPPPLYEPSVKIPKVEDPYETKLALDPRNSLNGLLVLIFSDERSIFYYNTVVVFGLFGIIWLYRQKIHHPLLIVTITAAIANLVLYSLFDDPWGGWAFGPRYLLPATALLTIFIGPFLEHWRRNIFLLTTFLIVLGYGLFINSLGAMTTTAVPPKHEAINLVDPIPYTYKYNWQLMRGKDHNNGLLYDLYFDETISSVNYLYLWTGLGLTVAASLLFLLWKNEYSGLSR